MAEGQVYVEVDASAVGGGIMPMAIVSGNPEPVAGQESFGVWLRWRYDTETGEGGFTGTGWYFDDVDNAINKQFTTEQQFKDYLIENTPQNLDSVLGVWDPIDKGEFFTRNQSKLGGGDCFFFAGSQG